MAGAEDLLIFKMREQAKKKLEPEKPQVQVEAKAVAPMPKPQPQVQEAAKPKGAGFEFFGMGKPKEEKPAPQPKPEMMAQPVREEAPVRAAEKTVFVQPKPAAVPKKARAKKGAKEELEQARGRFCEWHPWRPAYAVCDYCHRAFCYEDVEETGTGYYCLEDIDKISTSRTEQLYARYSNLSFASAGMFMLAFVVFIYFASGQLVYIFSYAHTVGFPAFVANLNYSYGSALLGLFLTGVGLLAGVLIFVQSRRGFSIGLFAALGDVALFSYLFLGSGTLYTALVAATSFIALVMLAYSKISYQAEETGFASPVSKPVDWSNPSRF